MDNKSDQERQQTWLEKVKSNLYGLQLPEWQLRSARRGKYIFTDNRHPFRGVLSFMLGVVALAALIASIVLSYRSGTVLLRYAFGAMLGLLSALFGLIEAFLSRRERDIYYLFPNLGLSVNIFVLLLGGGLLYLGFR